MVKNILRNILISKLFKVFFILFIILFIYNPIRKLIIYKSTNVYEDEPLGSFIHEYNNVNQFEILNLQPEEVDVQKYTYEKVKYQINIDQLKSKHPQYKFICSITK